jgi:hypothetical protein
MHIECNNHSPQEAADAAESGDTLQFDPSTKYTLTEPLVVTTPGITLRGLNLELADNTDENLIEIGAEDVKITGFFLDGNRSNQDGERQSSGIVITGTSRTLIGDGRIKDVSRHGLRAVDSSVGTSIAPGDTIHVERGPVSDVTLRNVRIDNPRRDGCSIEGPDLHGAVVENVRTVDSTDRGSVEVKDGAADAYVGHCYAKNCVYGVAVQDHGEYPTRNVRITNNTAIDCETLVDAQTSHPPEDVTIIGNVGRGLGGDGIGGPGGIQTHLIEGLLVANNLIDGSDGPGIVVRDCVDVTMNSNIIRDVAGPGIRLQCNEATMANLIVNANRVRGGIHLTGDIEQYLVTNNLLDVSVVDDTTGGGVVTNNLTGG